MLWLVHIFISFIVQWFCLSFIVLVLKVMICKMVGATTIWNNPNSKCHLFTENWHILSLEALGTFWLVLRLACSGLSMLRAAFAPTEIRLVHISTHTVRIHWVMHHIRWILHKERWWRGITIKVRYWYRLSPMRPMNHAASYTLVPFIASFDLRSLSYFSHMLIIKE